MKVSLNWLRDFVDVRLAAPAVREKLTLGGLEIEGEEQPGAAIRNVLVAEIVSIVPHPHADRLSLCDVRTGSGPTIAVVCGATNMKAGDRVAYAPPSTTLPDGRRIEQRAVRGIESVGMLCSEAELGLSSDADGILILDRAAPLGESVATFLGIDDTIFDVAVPPNRGDCSSILGVAREYAALTNTRLLRQRIAMRDRGPAVTEAVAVRIESGSGCGRYAARIVRDVTVAPSPAWLQRRLEGAGVRPINNVVDVTNYVMIERGQPLHAFDHARLAGREIVVRRAGASGSIETLDGMNRALDPNDIVISTGVDPIAIAGIMGGASSQVTQSTHTLLLESAWFDPSSVRRTARRLGLHSESSYRFERNVDIGGVLTALDRAAGLLQQIAGGSVDAGVVDVYPEPWSPQVVSVRLQRVTDVLGVPVSRGDATSALKALGADVSAGARGSLNVTPPTFRVDLTREIDLIEEIARLIGYDRIPATMPVVALEGGHTPDRIQWARELQRMLAARGLCELLCLSFTTPQLNHRFPGLNVPGDPIVVRNPMVRDESQLRRSLLGGLLTAVQTNRSQGTSGVAGFSVAKVFWRTDVPREGWRLGIVLARELPEHGLGARRVPEFTDAKGLVDAVLERMRVATRCRWQRASDIGSLHPGKSAAVWCGDELVGVVGCLHPDVEAELGGQDGDWLCELDLEKLLTYVPARSRYQELPRYPGVVRDLAIVSDVDFPSEQVIDFVRRWGNVLIEDVALFDQYIGDPIPAGSKSLAYSIRYRSADRTLTDDEVNRVHGELTAALSTTLPIELRR
jgi:phenylalanyl-tRNA synthetase beta chain